MGFIMIYITHSSFDEARKVTTHLLQKKLIACANSFPVESSYWWQGMIENDDEVVSIVKTRKENWERVKSEVEAIHPYDVPCIAKVDVVANENYESWIHSETECGDT